MTMNSFQYDEAQSSSNQSFLMGIVCGIGIGAVAALFFAPRRGAELRGQVADTVNRASQRAVDTYSRASETVNDIAGRAAGIAEDFTDRAATLTKKLNQSIGSKGSATIS